MLERYNKLEKCIIMDSLRKSKDKDSQVYKAIQKNEIIEHFELSEKPNPIFDIINKIEADCLYNDDYSNYLSRLNDAKNACDINESVCLDELTKLYNE